MGWERKRGKLHELNALLRGARPPTSSRPAPRRPSRRPTSATSSRSTPTPGCRGAPSPDWSARSPTRSIGRSSIRASGRVTRGYGILQPRITSTLPAEHEATIFQRAYSGAAGIDPYASAVSDVYQDLFGEGSYTGKGIYDLDAFEAAMADRVPENTLLSHDLFEGIYRPGRPGDRHRAVRRVPVPLPGSPCPPAPLGPRRLAAPAVDRGPRTATRRVGGGRPCPRSVAGR